MADQVGEIGVADGNGGADGADGLRGASASDPAGGGDPDRWGRQLERVLFADAGRSLRSEGEVAPALAALHGGELQMLAWLRPFPGGGHVDPIIELAALASPLGADGYALLMGARAWSLDDPPPEPSEDADDPRERVVILTLADAPAGRARVRSVLQPFTCSGGDVRWGARRELPEGEGQVVSILRVLVERPGAIPFDRTAARRQARRLITLGHELHLAPRVLARLGLRGCEPGGARDGGRRTAGGST